MTSFLNVKYDFNAFLDSLSLELRLRSIDRVYAELGVKSNQDTHYLRPKMEELFKEGLGTSPTYPTTNYSSTLALLDNKTLFNDLKDWSANSVTLILERLLSEERETEMIPILKLTQEKLSTLKLADILKKCLILEKIAFAKSFIQTLLSSKNHGRILVDTYIHSRTSSIKNREVIDLLVDLKSEKHDIHDFAVGFFSDLSKASNFEEIIKTLEYYEERGLSHSESSVDLIIGLLVNYDDWSAFKLYFAKFSDAGLLGEKTLKKVISSLVERSELDLLRFVVSILMKEGGCFLKLQLTENQYKFIILALIQSNKSRNSKLKSDRQRQSLLITEKSDPSNSDTENASHRSVADSDDESDAYLECIDEDMIQRIISDIAKKEALHKK